MQMPAALQHDEAERSPIASEEKRQGKRIQINLNRKLMTHAIIEQLRDASKSEGMLAGSAVAEVLDEYDRMRYIMEGLVTAYERNDETKVRQVLDLLRMLL